VVCHILLEIYWRGYNFALDLTSIGGLHTKLWASEVARVPILGILWFALGSPKKKWHLGVGPMAGIENIIRGKVVASSKSRPWRVLWIYVCPWLVHAPKCSNYALTNLLFGLYRSVWVIDFFVNLLSPHPGAPTCASTPKVLQAKEHAPIPFLSVVVTFGLTVESIKELGGASRIVYNNLLK
jgi:hypothetical protein